MALSTCRECRPQVSSEAASCPHCGVPSPAIGIQPHPADAKKREREVSRQRTLDDLRKGLIVLGGLALLAGLAKSGTNTSSESTSHDTPSMAETMCHEFVTNRLKAPSTAKFPYSHAEHKVDVLGSGHYRVVSYVDSQNGFGAQVRSTYVCEVTTSDNGKNWHADNVVIVTR